jgi:hypothetical protein
MALWVVGIAFEVRCPGLACMSPLACSCMPVAFFGQDRDSYLIQMVRNDCMDDGIVVV